MICLFGSESVNSHSYTIASFDEHEETTCVGNHVEKGENADYQHFLPLPQGFLHFQDNYHHFD